MKPSGIVLPRFSRTARRRSLLIEYARPNQPAFSLMRLLPGHPLFQMARGRSCSLPCRAFARGRSRWRFLQLGSDDWQRWAELSNLNSQQERLWPRSQAVVRVLRLEKSWAVVGALILNATRCGVSPKNEFTDYAFLRKKFTSLHCPTSAQRGLAVPSA